jgi:hypothetical protein
MNPDQARVQATDRSDTEVAILLSALAEAGLFFGRDWS